MKTAAGLALVLLLAACGRDGLQPPRKGGMLQTNFAGMVTAGGHTSGEVMAAKGESAAPQPGPAGTPGIPRGAGGNTGGAALGGTAPASPTPGAAAPTGPASASTQVAGAAPAVAASGALQPASAASAPGEGEAQKQKQELEAAMDAVAARWHARSARGDLPPRIAQAAASAASAAASAPIVPRSEKFGTAPPSPDVKTATKPATRPIVDRKSPEQAGPKP